MNSHDQYDRPFAEAICTASGRLFWPLDPLPQDVHAGDIAHALARINRFGGHARHGYSVAQHSVLCWRLATPESKAWALLHDAAEAYIGDIVRPIKKRMGFEPLEEKVIAAIADHFGLPLPIPDEVWAIDNRLLAEEVQHLMPPHPHIWDRWGWPSDDSLLDPQLFAERAVVSVEKEFRAALAQSLAPLPSFQIA